MSPHHDPTEFPEPTYKEAIEGWQQCQVDRAAALEALEEAQRKLEEIQALTLEPGHAVVDHITWHNALHRILRGSKEDE